MTTAACKKEAATQGKHGPFATVEHGSIVYSGSRALSVHLTRRGSRQLSSALLRDCLYCCFHYAKRDIFLRAKYCE
jgi:hypothetical protein